MTLLLNNSISVQLIADPYFSGMDWEFCMIHSYFLFGKVTKRNPEINCCANLAWQKCTRKRVWYNRVLQNLMHCTKFAFHRIKKYIQLLRQFAAVQQGQLWTFRITASQLQILIPDVFTCLGRCAFSDCIVVFSDCCLYSCWKNSNDFHADVFAKKGSVRSKVYDSKCCRMVGRCVNASL